jgi:hypothetical protein
MRALRRHAAVLVFLSILATTIVELGQHDLLPLSIENWVEAFLAPGVLLRGVASGSELGFQDWRDVALMAVGSAGAFTGIFAILDGVYRRWQRKSDASAI